MPRSLIQDRARVRNKVTARPVAHSSTRESSARQFWYVVQSYRMMGFCLGRQGKPKPGEQELLFLAGAGYPALFAVLIYFIYSEGPARVFGQVAGVAFVS